MRILLTGATGLVGDYMLEWFLARGHTVHAIDQRPIAPARLAELKKKHPSTFTSDVVDLADYTALDAQLDTQAAFEGVVHLAAIPNPLSNDPRMVHNNNVAVSYNVLETCTRRGVRRLVQASSCNAAGLTYGPEGHLYFPSLPLREDSAMRPEDAYALSKAICELQADGICRFYPGTRIASLRFHLVSPTQETAAQTLRWQDLWGWSPMFSCAEAAFLALTTDTWEGHEVFNIVDDQICWAGVEEPYKSKEDWGSLDLLEQYWDRSMARWM